MQLTLITVSLASLREINQLLRKIGPGFSDQNLVRPGTFCSKILRYNFGGLDYKFSDMAFEYSMQGVVCSFQVIVGDDYDDFGYTKGCGMEVDAVERSCGLNVHDNMIYVSFNKRNLQRVRRKPHVREARCA